VGSGSTGEIFECLWKGVRVAAKRISLSTVPKEEINVFMNEIALLKRLRHPNIGRTLICLEINRCSSVYGDMPSWRKFVHHHRIHESRQFESSPPFHRSRVVSAVEHCN
jgi:serine/threonine protein kinase